MQVNDTNDQSAFKVSYVRNLDSPHVGDKARPFVALGYSAQPNRFFSIAMFLRLTTYLHALSPFANRPYVFSLANKIRTNIHTWTLQKQARCNIFWTAIWGSIGSR